jgi:hypothetical protein
MMGATLPPMSTPEALLKTALRHGFEAWSKSLPVSMTGAICVALGQPQGLPDRYFGIPGKFAWIEAKAGVGKKVLKKASQIQKCSDLAACGQRVHVVWCENLDLPPNYRQVVRYQVLPDRNYASEILYTWDTLSTDVFWGPVFA